MHPPPAKGGKRRGEGLYVWWLIPAGWYSFYGFPDHYYKEKFPTRGSPKLAQTVLAMLNDEGIPAKGVQRGLDHGVWACFKCGNKRLQRCLVMHELIILKLSTPK